MCLCVYKLHTFVCLCMYFYVCVMVCVSVCAAARWTLAIATLLLFTRTSGRKNKVTFILNSCPNRWGLFGIVGFPKSHIVRQCIYFNSSNFTIKTNSLFQLAVRREPQTPQGSRWLVGGPFPLLSSCLFILQTVPNPLECSILHLKPGSSPLITDANPGGDTVVPWPFKSLEWSEFSRTRGCILLSAVILVRTISPSLVPRTHRDAFAVTF